MNVIVVGAGAAGLAATHTLRKAGAAVTLFEASAHAGGRARCYEKEGFIFDIGAQFFAGACKTQIGFAREFGFGHEVRNFPLEAGLWRDGQIYPLPPLSPLGILRYGYRFLPAMRALPLKVFFQLPLLGLHMLRHLVSLEPRSLNPYGLLGLGDTSVADFTLKYAGQEALDWVMRPAIGGLTVGEAEHVSITHMIALMGLYQGLYLMDRGIGSIMEALYQANKEKIKLSTPVKEIVLDNGQVKGVLTAGGFTPADHVICATTASMARKLMPGLPYSIGRALDTVRYSSCVHVMLGLKERLLPGNLYAVPMPTDAKSFLIGLYDGSYKSSKSAPAGTGLSHCVTFGTRAPELMGMDDAEVVERVIKEVVRLGGNIRTKPIVADVIRFEEAICLEAPGQFPAMYCMKRTAKNDVAGLHLAGEYNYLVSCVEGSLRSGVERAQEILAAQA